MRLLRLTEKVKNRYTNLGFLGFVCESMSVVVCLKIHHCYCPWKLVVKNYKLTNIELYLRLDYLISIFSFQLQPANKQTTIFFIATSQHRHFSLVAMFWKICYFWGPNTAGRLYGNPNLCFFFFPTEMWSSKTS